MTETYDLAIVGGGIMGCSTALRLAEDGMKTIVLDQGDLGQGASGVNAGTLSLQIKRVQLMPYALKGHSEWEAMGEAVGFKRRVVLRLLLRNMRLNFCTNVRL